MSRGLIIVADPECRIGLDPKAVRRCFETMANIDQWREGEDLSYNEVMFECRFSCGGSESAQISVFALPTVFVSIDRTCDCCLLAALEIQKHYDGELYVIIGDDQSSATSLKSVSSVAELRNQLDA